MSTISQAAAENLKQLLIIRAIVLGSQIIALATALFGVHAEVPYLPLLFCIVVMSALTCYAWVHLKHASYVSEAQMFAHIAADVLAISIFTYFSGGATNPFVSFLLIPISIAATTLRWNLTWIIAAGCVGAYTFLLFYYRPLAMFELSGHELHTAQTNPHIVGMWLNFVFSTAIITYFIVRMAARLRIRERQLQATREKNLQDEQMLAVATLAAGTAHELATPLSTIAINLDELAHLNAHAPEQARAIEVLQEQVDICRECLSNLVTTANDSFSVRSSVVTSEDFFADLFDHWYLLRPEVPIKLSWQQEDIKSTRFHADPTLRQALLNLLNNAADASPELIQMTIGLSNHDLKIELRDRGSGISLELADSLGTPFQSNKETGMGLGLFLSNATLNRLGGNIRLFNHPEGGTLTQIMLPVLNQ